MEMKVEQETVSILDEIPLPSFAVWSQAIPANKDRS